MNSPELGVGLVYSPSLELFLDEAGHDLVDVIEVEPQMFWFPSRSVTRPHRLDRAALDRIAQYRQPKIVHSVGCPIGGTASDRRHWTPLCETIRLLRSPWASEHLSFNWVNGADGAFHSGFLLPPLQSPTTVAVAVSNIRQLRAYLQVPLAFETGVNYLSPDPQELTDGAFFAAVAEGADCGILLDLHNLWANERNGRQAVLEVIGELPLERVWEVHLAGGDEFDGYWVDAHSGIVPPAVMELAADVVPRLPNVKAVVFEVGAEYVAAGRLGTDDLVDQMRRIRAIWDGRRTRPVTTTYGTTARAKIEVAPTANTRVPTPREWEEALGNAVNGLSESFDLRLAHEPGVRVLRRMVEAARGGMIVDGLTLTSRYLMLALGEPVFWRLLEAFWASTRPELFPSRECHNFGTYLRQLDVDLPCIGDVLEFELACHHVVTEGSARVVKFSCDPWPLLADLAEGRRPPPPLAAEVELRIEPRRALFSKVVLEKPQEV